MTTKKKRKSLVGWTNRCWDACSGDVGYFGDIALPKFIAKRKPGFYQKVRITVEAL